MKTGRTNLSRRLNSLIAGIRNWQKRRARMSAAELRIEPGSISLPPLETFPLDPIIAAKEDLNIEVHIDTHQAEVTLQRLATQAQMTATAFDVLKSRMDIMNRTRRPRRTTRRK